MQCGVAYGLPMDGVVSAGNAQIHSSGRTVDVHQHTNKAVIDWRGFDVAPHEQVRFAQPSAKAITLNRVHSDRASVINGTLTANGKVVIVNQNGVLFGSRAKVDVAGLVATTADISNDAFMHKDVLHFDKVGRADAAIINEGTITAREAGLVGLVAPYVLNSGTITAKLGNVQLASGDSAAIDMYGDGLVQIAVSDKVKNQLVANSGSISADGGSITMSAAAGKEIVNSLIAQTGALQARSVAQRQGKIVIAAEGSNAVVGNEAAHKGKKSGASTVINSGVLDVSGRNAGERGGVLHITGDKIALHDGTRIDASGHSGAAGTTRGKTVSALRDGAAGGDIRIGGDYLGQGTTPTAKQLYVDKGALILNDALHTGDAGRTIFWADDSTHFYGNVYARALGGKPIDATTWQATLGGNAGDGGFVETSGKRTLDALGYVDLTASAGERGTYLLDPTDITIYGDVTADGLGPAPGYVSTGGEVNLSTGARMWIDASDTSRVELTFSTDGLSSATANGTSGSTTITTSANVATQLAVGARIRLGSAGTAAFASTMGADTYTITAISGTNITVAEPLSQTYTTSALHRGLVSRINDRSGNGRNAIQTTQSRMPLWRSNQLNGRGGAVFDGLAATESDRDNFWIHTALAASLGTNFHNRAVASSTSTTDMLLFAAAAPSSATDMSVIALTSASRQFGMRATGRVFQRDTAAVMTPATPRYDNGAAHIMASTIISGTGTDVYVNGPSRVSGANITPHTVSGANAGYIIGNNAWNDGRSWVGPINEIMIYADTSTSTRHLLDQYQSAKWGIALTPPGTGADEVTRATAADGYSVFTTRYLERLSQSANVSLVATNNITLDLKGDNLNFSTSGRSLTMNAGNAISTASAGSITTNNGAISLTAGTGGINFAHAFSLNSGTAATTLTSSNSAISFANALTLGGNTTLNAGSGTATFSSTVNGARNLTATAGTFSFGGALGGITPLANVSLTSTNALSLPAISASNVLARATAGNLTLGGNITASGSGNAIVLDTSGNITNAGNHTLSPGTGRSIVYSTSAASNIWGGLTAAQTISGQTYGTLAPSAITTPTYNATQNTFVYSTVAGIVRFTANNATRTYGDANPTFTYSFWCSTGCTESAAVTGTPLLSTSAVQGSNVSTYAINIAQGSLALQGGFTGFTFDFVNGTLTVDPRVVTAVLQGAVSKTYNGTTAATLNASNYQLNNVYNSDDVVLNNPTSGTYDSRHVGTAKRVDVTGLSLSGTKSSNYTLNSTAIHGNVGDITAKALTITAGGTTMVYGDGNSFNGYSASGLESVDSISGVSFASNATLSTSGNWNQGSWNITPSAATGTGLGNYNISYALGTLSISPKALTLSAASGGTRIYNGTDVANVTGTLGAGVISSDVVSLVAPTTATFADRHVGTAKAITHNNFTLS
ncbi:MAG: filamentous hemagglutinin N-terminal domain-containing protein, partial [Alphaproteobacteria bacterium]